jgi:serine/threonine protein kinase
MVLFKSLKQIKIYIYKYIKMNNKKDNKDEYKNLSVIEQRLLSIKKLLEGTNLDSINPLKNANKNADTECFGGQINELKSQDTRTILGKRTLNFYRVINKLKAQLRYMKSGAAGHTFKGMVFDNDNNEVSSFAVKVVAYPKRDGFGNMHNIARPENAEICMLKLLSYFVIKGMTPHIILPISIFDTSIEPFLSLQTADENDTFVSINNKNYKEFIKYQKQGKYYDKVSIVISEWANRGDLGMFLKKNYKKLKLIHWQCLFFQILSVLAIIQYKYPNFRHNDLKPNNILISKIGTCNKKLLYKVDNKEYVLPAISYYIYIWDFDFACIPGVVENAKIYQEWTNNMNINSTQNRYYDVHYFFCTLIYKGFLPELMNEPCVPKEVKDFINYVVPEKYRPINQTCAELVKKMLMDDNISQSLKNEIKTMSSMYSVKSLSYREFINKINNDEKTSSKLKDFFKKIPDKYKQKVNERCRLLVNDELYLPANLLDNVFFKPFH